VSPFSESLFRTLKYCPQWPSDGFGSIEEGREWVNNFMNFYNNKHRHSQIQFVTPAQRHQGEDPKILRKRDLLYARAKSRHPRRWSGATRNWRPVGAVMLNPGRELNKIKTAA